MSSLPDVIREKYGKAAARAQSAGALDETAYREKLTAAGFGSIELEPWRVYKAGEFGIEDGVVPPDAFASTFIRAVKPVVKLCCGPDCCTS